MPRAFTMMTAMPPTTGHLQLIQFGKLLTGHFTQVIVCTQPGEPFAHERFTSILHATDEVACVRHVHRELEQNPEAPGFKEMWAGILIGAGIQPGDYIITSEPYGKWLAELTGAEWFPYDVRREINSVRATAVRQHPAIYWDKILPEFRPHLQTRVTIFGAESTGKTTLARSLYFRNLDERDADEWREREWGYFPEVVVLPEYARPYLEQTVNEITPRSMNAIWRGQYALQAQTWLDYPMVIQDTDLFSTVGYWQGMVERIGEPMPGGLAREAKSLQSDLYVIPQSNIAFEPDPLRYGGNHRELPDQYWITLAQSYNLPFEILQSSDKQERVREAAELAKGAMMKKFEKLSYERAFN